MTVKKTSWKSMILSCFQEQIPEETEQENTKKEETTTKHGSSRVSIADLSYPSSTTMLSEDLSISLAGSNIHAFTFAELKVITQSFASSNFLGEGGFGPVHKGFIDDRLRPGLTAQPVAVKLLDLDGLQGHREWLAEVIFLGKLRHPNLVKLIGYCCEEEHRLLVYEYMPRGSLENQLFRRYSVSLPWSTRMKIAYGAAKGLAFLHEAEKPVIYRDFKASNILLDSDYTAKLSDFGLAKNGPEGDDTHVSTRVMGTQGYAAPEYIMTGHLTAMSDVYSFGVVFLELLTGRKSLDKTRPPREHNLVDWARPMLQNQRKLSRFMDPRLEEQYSETGAIKAAALAYLCLSHRPKQRPTMSAVVGILEKLKDYKDIPMGPFVYTVPTEVPTEVPTDAHLPKEENEVQVKKETNNSKIHNYNKHYHTASPSNKSPIHHQSGIREGSNKSPIHHQSGIREGPDTRSPNHQRGVHRHSLDNNSPNRQRGVHRHSLDNKSPNHQRVVQRHSPPNKSPNHRENVQRGSPRNGMRQEVY